jgi:SAM-dependent methyltransferase
MNEWESQYKLGKGDCIFPFTDLVSCVYRYVKPFAGMKVLELGCGTGANIPLFQNLGSDYYAVEGSQSAVEILAKRYPQYKSKITVGDFTKTLPQNSKFDLIVDRSSMTHNTTEEIVYCLDCLFQLMNNNAYYIGIDWFSESHSDYNKSTIKLDDNTFDGFTSGQFQNIGKVHFSTEPHLKYLFKNYTIKMLDHKVVLDLFSHRIATYNIVAKKLC